MKLPSKELQQFMRDNMTSEEYDHNQMFVLYSEIMDREGLYQKYSVMTQVSLDRRMLEWKWLIKKGEGRHAIYYKRWCHRTDKSRPQILKDVINKLRGILCLKY